MVKSESALIRRYIAVLGLNNANFDHTKLRYLPGVTMTDDHLRVNYENGEDIFIVDSSLPIVKRLRQAAQYSNVAGRLREARRFRTGRELCHICLTGIFEITSFEAYKELVYLFLERADRTADLVVGDRWFAHFCPEEFENELHENNTEE